jgi:6-phosphogluconolactonase
MTRCSVVVLPDARSLAVAAAAAVVAEARGEVRRKGYFSLALSGGDTPEPIYELLAKPPMAGLVPWQETYVFWGDERCVASNDPRSNERLARQALLDQIPVPAAQIHPMKCAGPKKGSDSEGPQGESAAWRAADDYERLLRGLFGQAAGAGAGSRGLGEGIDLVLLGIGENGHTASLFPGSDILHERERWAVAALEDPATAAATSGTGEKLWRVTMTATFINRASLALFVVSGASKAAVVRAAIEGDADPHVLPARLIYPADGRLWWLLDQDAASQLQGAPGVQMLWAGGSEPGRWAGGAGGTAPARPGPGLAGAGAKRCGGGPSPGAAGSAEEAGETAPESFDDLPECEMGPSR